MMTKIEELDVVELLQDRLEDMLVAGMRGTILEVYDGGTAYLVEFDDDAGREIALTTLQPKEIKLVWRNATREYVYPLDQLIEEVRHLSNEQLEELLSMVRNLRNIAA